MSRSEKHKEENYFDMFVESVSYTCDAAAMLLDVAKNYGCEDCETRASKLHNIEHEADIHCHRIFDQLHRSFITPIEREDIMNIASSIDDVTDLIEDIVYKFFVFDVQRLRDDVVPYVEMISRATIVLKVAMTEFKHYKRSKVLKEKLIEINDIEEEADRFYRDALKNLFTTETRIVEVVKWREIYKMMEDCLDACEDISDVIRGAVLKNS